MTTGTIMESQLTDINRSKDLRRIAGFYILRQHEAAAKDSRRDPLHHKVCDNGRH
jgi:hypothetical protein